MKYNQALPNINSRHNHSEEDVPINRKRNLSLSLSTKCQNTSNCVVVLSKVQKKVNQYSPRKPLGFFKQGKIYKNANLMKKCQKNFQAYLRLQNKLIKQQQQNFHTILLKQEQKKPQHKPSKLSVSYISIPIFKNATSRHIKCRKVQKPSHLQTEYKSQKIIGIYKTQSKKQNEQRQLSVQNKKYKPQGQRKYSFVSHKKYKQMSFNQKLEVQIELSHLFANKIMKQKIKLITDRIRHSLVQNSQEIKGW